MTRIYEEGELQRLASKGKALLMLADMHDEGHTDHGFMIGCAVCAAEENKKLQAELKWAYDHLSNSEVTIRRLEDHLKEREPWAFQQDEEQKHL